MLTLQGIPVYVSGVAGHFVGSQSCVLRLHWRIGSLRISTVGACLREGGRTQVMLGSGRWSETMIFRVSNNGTPEGELVDADYNPIAMVTCGTRDSRDAEHLHYLVASQIAAAFAHEQRELTDDEVGRACRFAELLAAFAACEEATTREELLPVYTETDRREMLARPKPELTADTLDELITRAMMQTCEAAADFKVDADEAERLRNVDPLAKMLEMLGRDLSQRESGPSE